MKVDIKSDQAGGHAETAARSFLGRRKTGLRHHHPLLDAEFEVNFVVFQSGNHQHIVQPLQAALNEHFIPELFYFLHVLLNLQSERFFVC